MVDEGWTTVEKKTPKEAASGGRGGGAGANKERARGSGARGDPRRSRPRDCPSLFFPPHRRHGPQTLLCSRGAIGRPRARAPAPFAARPLATRVRPLTIPAQTTALTRTRSHVCSRARGMPRADPPITTAVPAAGSPVDGTTTRASPASTATAAATPRTPPPRRRARCRARRRLRRRRVSRRRRAARRAPRRGPSPRRRRRASRERHARPGEPTKDLDSLSQAIQWAKAGQRRDPGDSRRLRFPAPAPPRSPRSSSRAAAAASGRRRWSSTPP